VEAFIKAIRLNIPNECIEEICTTFPTNAIAMQNTLAIATFTALTSFLQMLATAAAKLFATLNNFCGHLSGHLQQQYRTLQVSHAVLLKSFTASKPGNSHTYKKMVMSK
jgi:hypothetical protein